MSSEDNNVICVRPDVVDDLASVVMRRADELKVAPIELVAVTAHILGVIVGGGAQTPKGAFEILRARATVEEIFEEISLTHPEFGGLAALLAALSMSLYVLDCANEMDAADNERLARLIEGTE